MTRRRAARALTISPPDAPTTVPRLEPVGKFVCGRCEYPSTVYETGTKWQCACGTVYEVYTHATFPARRKR